MKPIISCCGIMLMWSALLLTAYGQKTSDSLRAADLLPFSRDAVPIGQSTLEFGAGALTYWPDLRGLNEAFNAKEAFYKAQPRPAQFGFDVQLIPAFNLVIHLTNDYLLETQIATDLGGNKEIFPPDGAVSIRALTLAVTRRFISTPERWTHPFVTAGWTSVHFRLEQAYGTSLPDGGTLQSIIAEGSSAGFLGAAGVVLDAGPGSPALRCQASLFLLPNKLVTIYGLPANVGLTSISFGAQLMIPVF